MFSKIIEVFVHYTRYYYIIIPYFDTCVLYDSINITLYYFSLNMTIKQLRAKNKAVIQAIITILSKFRD